MYNILQLIFFFSVALLGIVITLYVLAVSLLGRAINLSIEEQEAAEKKLRLSVSEELEKMEAQFLKAKKKKKFDTTELSKRINKLKWQERGHVFKLFRIRLKPKLLSANFGALFPGAFFLIAAIFSALTLYNFNEATRTYPQTTLLLALGFLVVGILFVCIILKAIEGVAKTSDETGFKREAAVIKAAMKEIELDKTPEIVLAFKPEKPPFKMLVDSVKDIIFQLQLTRGTQALKPRVLIMAPPDFDFPNTEGTWRQPLEHNIMPNYISASCFTPDLYRTIATAGKIHIKAPSKKGKFVIYYVISADTYSGEREDFEVIIE